MVAQAQARIATVYTIPIQNIMNQRLMHALDGHRQLARHDPADHQTEAPVQVQLASMAKLARTEMGVDKLTAVADRGYCEMGDFKNAGSPWVRQSEWMYYTETAVQRRCRRWWRAMRPNSAMRHNRRWFAAH
jgi:hypothetical protein